MENYKIFFENLCLINKKYNLINSKKEDFNIFSILRNEYDEVNLHSKFIVELLKNKNYGKKFIEIFLEKLEIQVFNYENVYVFSEYSKGINGRIDILLEFSKGKEKKAIIIENKIYAEDQIGQLNRYYYSMINKNYSNDDQFEKFVKKHNVKYVYPISGIANEGIKPVLMKAWEMIKEIPREELEEEYSVDDLLREMNKKDDWIVKKTADNVFEVDGRIVDDVLKKYVFIGEEGIINFLQKMRSLGMETELEKAGVEEGDIIIIAGYEFEYII